MCCNPLDNGTYGVDFERNLADPNIAFATVDLCARPLIACRGDSKQRLCCKTPVLHSMWHAGRAPLPAMSAPCSVSACATMHAMRVLFCQSGARLRRPCKPCRPWGMGRAGAVRGRICQRVPAQARARGRQAPQALHRAGGWHGARTAAPCTAPGKCW